MIKCNSAQAMSEEEAFDVAFKQSHGTGSGGKKDDAGKVQWNLIILGLLEGVVRVLMYGAKKYAPQSWQIVPEGRQRYWDALQRHLYAMQSDDGSINLDKRDSETGLPHLWHMQTNAYFLEHFRRQDVKALDARP